MTTIPVSTLSPRKPLRLWPGVALALMLLIVRALPLVAPDGEMFGMPMAFIGLMGAVLLGALIFLWWLLFSRAPWRQRLGAMVLIAVGVYITYFLVDESIRGAFMGRMMILFSIPVLGLALVMWAIASRHLTPRAQNAALVGAIALGCGVFTLIRTDGVIGEAGSQLQWRWTETAEERLLAQERREPVAPASAVAPAAAAVEPPPAPAPLTPPSAPVPAPAPSDVTSKRDGGGADATRAPAAGVARRAEWPGFRGPDRDAVIRGVRIASDWSTSPPVEVWRRAIGPGWSSFAVQGDLIYTQEQRGEEEMVSAYRLSTGEPVWRHRDHVRFYESNGGAGPRGTPAIDGGRVYAAGATGLLNALDAATGRVVWTRNAAADTGVALPGWGFTSSPVVVDDCVIIALSGQLAAYDTATGEVRWMGPKGGSGYSSPHLVSIDGVPQILLLRGSRTVSVSPKDGALLWEHTWIPGVGIVQPALTAEGDVLIATGDAMGGLGLRRVSVAREGGEWKVAERWTTRGLKPYFNDFVVHKGHAFGFDGSILSAIDLQDGTRKWKGGRYGNGQMMLLQEQDLLLVLSEEGELALVQALPDQFTEVARFKALDAKTWNHPVLVGDMLLVRNGEEMAAFRMPIVNRATTSR